MMGSQKLMSSIGCPVHATLACMASGLRGSATASLLGKAVVLHGQAPYTTRVYGARDDNY